MPQRPQVFSVRGFEALFPPAETLGCSACLAPQLFLLVYVHTNVGPPTPPAAVLPESPPPRLPIPASPTSLDECSVFNFLVVGLPYCSIFWQFSLFFVFKFVVVLLLVVQGGKVYLYLSMPPSWLEVSQMIFFSPQKFIF